MYTCEDPLERHGEERELDRDADGEEADEDQEGVTEVLAGPLGVGREPRRGEQDGRSVGHAGDGHEGAHDKQQLGQLSCRERMIPCPRGGVKSEKKGMLCDVVVRRGVFTLCCRWVCVGPFVGRKVARFTFVATPFVAWNIGCG